MNHSTIASDPITIAPTIVGEQGRAWRADLAAGWREMGIKREDDAVLDHWIVEAPWAHAFWHSYSIIVMHLRPMPDNRPTKFYLDGATHELWVMAMNPDTPREPLIRTGIVKGHWLSPGNFASQFIEVADDLAQARVYAAVADITAGKLSPDTDYTLWWQRLFAKNMMKKGAGETRISLGDEVEIVVPPVPLPPKDGP